MIRSELFPLDAYDAAQRRFAELARDQRSPAVDNRAVRVVMRDGWHARHGDRTPAHPVTDVDAALRCRRRRYTPLAVRGDSLALFAWTPVADGDDPAGLALVALGEGAQIAEYESFAADDLTGAVNALEAWHLRLREGQLSPVERRLVQVQDAVNRRDWNAVRQTSRPGTIYRRHGLLGDLTLEDWVANLAETVTQVPDVFVVLAKYYATDHAALGVFPIHGTTPEGSRYRWERLTVISVDNDGRTATFDQYEAEQWVGALARFDELAS